MLHSRLSTKERSIPPSYYFDDERIDLTDVVRKKNTNKKSFTYESVAQK